MKARTHINISAGAEKSFDKFQHLFLIKKKNLSKFNVYLNRNKDHKELAQN